jgi:hypothetical protein
MGAMPPLSRRPYTTASPEVQPSIPVSMDTVVVFPAPEDKEI